MQTATYHPADGKPIKANVINRHGNGQVDLQVEGESSPLVVMCPVSEHSEVGYAVVDKVEVEQAKKPAK